MAIGDAQRYEITLSDFPLFKMYHYTAGTSSDKAIWSDAGKTTPLAQPAVADANGQLSFFADGHYRLVFKDSTDVSISGMDYDNFVITSDMATTFEDNQGTVLPSASSEKNGHLFLLQDVSSNILGIYVCDGTQYKAMATFSAAGDQAFSSVLTNGMPDFNVQHPDWGALGDGTTGDGTKIASCIADLVTAGGGRVYLPTGIYNVDDSKIPIGASPIKIYGDGPGQTIIRRTALPGTPGPLFTYTPTDITYPFIMENLSIETTVVGASGDHAVSLNFPSDAVNTYAPNVIINNVVIGPTNADKATARFDYDLVIDGAKKTFITNLFCRGNVGNNSNGQGIRIIGYSKNIHLTNCIVHNKSEGILFGGNADEIFIIGLHSEQCNYNIDIETTANLTINKSNLSAITRGIYQGASAKPILLLEGNFITKHSGSTASWNGVSGDYSYFRITNNKFHDSGSSSGTDIGINLDDSDVGLIQGNNFSDLDNSGSKSIALSANSSNIVVSNNYEYNVDSVSTDAGSGNIWKDNHPTVFATITAAASIALVPYTDYIELSGVTNVTTITGGWIGRTIHIFRAGRGASTGQIQTGGNLKLAANRTIENNNNSTLIWDGSNWIETAYLTVA